MWPRLVPFASSERLANAACAETWGSKMLKAFRNQLSTTSRGTPSSPTRSTCRWLCQAVPSKTLPNSKKSQAADAILQSSGAIISSCHRKHLSISSLITRRSNADCASCLNTAEINCKEPESLQDLGMSHESNNEFTWTFWMWWCCPVFRFAVCDLSVSQVLKVLVRSDTAICVDCNWSCHTSLQ